MSPSGSPGHGVIVVGSVNVDLVIDVARFPAPGETVTGGRFARHHGGKSANQAVAAARLGAPVSLVAAVGGDDLGADACDALAAEGIDVSAVVTLSGEVTGVAFILVDARGENLIAVASGANGALTPDHVASALGALRPGPGDVVLVGHEIPTASAVAALRLGRQARATTVLNPAPATGIGRDALQLTDILTPNAGELELLAAREGPPHALARALLDATPSLTAVLVTLGGRGADLVTADTVEPIPAVAVEVVDTVGAGDTLNGALAAGLAAGRPLAAAAREAVAAAGLVVTRHGARGGMPSRIELDAALGDKA